jgi:hypothetical protein
LCLIHFSDPLPYAISAGFATRFEGVPVMCGGESSIGSAQLCYIYANKTWTRVSNLLLSIGRVFQNQQIPILFYF